MKRFRCFRWRVAGLQQLQDDNDIKCMSAGVQGSRLTQQDMKNKLMRYSCGCNLCSKTQPIPSRDPLERGPLIHQEGLSQSMSWRATCSVMRSCYPCMRKRQSARAQLQGMHSTMWPKHMRRRHMLYLHFKLLYSN
ncbi:hypothetical protein Peur_073035 [Populus x canadensis]